jgi:hypothetical protein
VSPGYVRLYADADGETHFEDVELPAEERSAAAGGRTAVCAAIPVEGLIFRSVLDDGDADAPHNAPYPVFIITLAGAAEVTTSDGERRVFGPGSVVLVEDTSGRGHVTRPLGEHPRVTLFAPVPTP